MTDTNAAPNAPGEAAEEQQLGPIRHWIKNHPTRVGNIDRVLAEIREAEPAPAGHPRLAVISVALRTLSSAS